MIPMASKRMSTELQNSLVECVHIIKLALADILRSQIPPEELYKKVTSSSKVESGHYKLEEEHRRIFFFDPSPDFDYEQFDVYLLYILIRNLCTKIEPTNGWGKYGKRPKSAKEGIGEDIERLINLRFWIYARLESLPIPSKEFVSYINELRNILQRTQNFLSSCSYNVHYETNIEKLAIIGKNFLDFGEKGEESEGKEESERKKEEPAGKKVESEGNVKDTDNILEEFQKWFYDEYKETKLVHYYYGRADIAKEKVKEGDEVIVAVIDSKKVMEKEMPFRYRDENIPVIWKLWKEDSKEATIGIEEELELQEEHIDKLTSIGKYLEKNTKYLFKRHSNLQMVLASTYRLKKGKIDKNPCIVLYCSCKGIVPINEPRFRTDIDGIKTDVREGFFHLLSNRNDDFCALSTDLLDPLRMGASIGKKGELGEGTLGGFVKFEEGVGFVTCGHNLYNIDEMELPTAPAVTVVQPSYLQAKSQVCGQVVRSAFPTNEEEKYTVDATLVRLTKRPPGELLFANLLTTSLINCGFSRSDFPRSISGTPLDLKDIEDRNFLHRSKKYLKCGTTTGLTTGILSLTPFYGKIMFANNQGKYFSNQIVIIGEDFCKPGDSGSFVFQVREDGSKELCCIGMAVGRSSVNKIAVIPIIPLLSALNVHLIPYDA